MRAGDLAALLLSSVGALLGVAGISKVRALNAVERFLEEIGLGARSSQVVARVAIFLELGLGVLTLGGFVPLASALAAGAIGVVFVAIQSRAMRLELHTSCGCFGSLSGSRRTGWDSARAWVFLGFAVAAAVACGYANATTAMLDGYATSRVLGFLVGIGCVLCLAIAEQSSLLLSWQRESAEAEA